MVTYSREGRFFGQLNNLQFSRSLVAVSQWGMPHKPAGRGLTHFRHAATLSLFAAQCKMRHAAAQLFHATIALYLLCMDLLYALKLIEVLMVRTDLLWAHYRGLGLQFFTVWSQVSTFVEICAVI
jgi:hypothetical protein